jgi:hypothetical protein
MFLAAVKMIVLSDAQRSGNMGAAVVAGEHVFRFFLRFRGILWRFAGYLFFKHPDQEPDYKEQY